MARTDEIVGSTGFVPRHNAPSNDIERPIA